MIDIEKARILNGKDREETIKTIELKEEIIEEYRQEIERLNNIINKKEQFLGDNIKRLEREIVKRDNIINELNVELKRYKSIVYLCEKVKDSDKE